MSSLIIAATNVAANDKKGGSNGTDKKILVGTLAGGLVAMVVLVGLVVAMWTRTCIVNKKSKIEK